MISSTNTVNIDGAAIKTVDLKALLSSDSDDRFVQWVVRPLAILAAIGVGAAVLFASAVLIMVSLALLPLIAVAMWAMKTKIERELKDSDAEIVAVDEVVAGEHGQTAS